MAIPLVCPSCRKTIQAPEKLAGQKAVCPSCKAVVQISHQCGEANVGASPGVQGGRSAPTVHQRPVSQPNARAVMNKPEAADSGDGMSRQMKTALIALPTVAVVVGAIFIWSFEKSRQEARRQEAQAAAQKSFDEAQQALAQKNIPEALQKLKAYLSDENATKTSEAKKFLAEIELATSENAASDTLVKMGEDDFQRFQQSRHHNDKRITHPVLVKAWDSLLLSTLPKAKKGREEAEAKRLAELKANQGIPVTPSELLTAFANVLAAEAQYKGKILEVTGFVVYENGPVLSVGEYGLFKKTDGREETRCRVLNLPPPKKDVWDVVKCSFADRPEGLYREKVTIRGRCSGGYSLEVSLDGCSVVKNFRDERLANERELRAKNERDVLTRRAEKLDETWDFTDIYALPREDIFGPIATAYDYNTGKVLEVTGKVRVVDRDRVALDGWWSPDSVVDAIEVRLDRLSCYFMPKHEEEVRKLARGQSVTIRGVVGFVEPKYGARPFLKFCVLVR